MKIITWNINGYRSITGQNPSKKYDKVTKENKLFKFIESEQPDILCLQETKADVDQINEELKCPEGYHSYYHSCSRKKGYSGVVTFSKEKAIMVNNHIGIEEFDIEGRVVETKFQGFTIFNVYFPKGYTDHERLDYKLNFYDALYKYIKKKLKKEKNIIISGDYNTAHNEIDLARPKQNTNTSGFLEIERIKLEELVKMKFIDTFRLFTDENGHYTWWSQRGRARENNVGWRIDYHFISKSLGNKVTNSYHLPEQDGSDHCPVVLELNLI